MTQTNGNSSGSTKVGGRTAIVRPQLSFCPPDVSFEPLLFHPPQVGTGSRGQLYLRGVVDRITSPDSPNKVVALCDANIGRVQYYNRLLKELGQPVSVYSHKRSCCIFTDNLHCHPQPAAEYTADRFEEMLDKEKVEVLVVTTMDSTHDRYISESS